MTQDLALGEVQSLAQKAARGAGRAFGPAEDAGRAVRWLCARGYDGAGALVALLKATDGWDARALVTSDEGQCPLALGAYISDTGDLPEGEFGPVVAPILLAPFLAQLAGDDAIELSGHLLQLEVTENGLSGVAVQTATILTVAKVTTTNASRPVLTRAQIADHHLETLQGFAARTYAPATEASRLRGAGAGTSDND